MKKKNFYQLTPGDIIVGVKIGDYEAFVPSRLESLVIAKDTNVQSRSDPTEEVVNATLLLRSMELLSMAILSTYHNNYMLQTRYVDSGFWSTRSTLLRVEDVVFEVR